MRLEVEGRLPEGSRLYLEAPLLFLELAHALSPFVEIDKERGVGRMPVPIASRYALPDMVFPTEARFAMRLLAQIPKKHRARTYRVVARQMHGKDELGRVTWLLTPKRQKG